MNGKRIFDDSLYTESIFSPFRSPFFRENIEVFSICIIFLKHFVRALMTSTHLMKNNNILYNNIATPHTHSSNTANCHSLTDAIKTS